MHAPTEPDSPARRREALVEQIRAETCPPAAAAHLVERARRIAESMDLGIAGAKGLLLRRGERYLRPTGAWTPPA